MLAAGKFLPWWLKIQLFYGAGDLADGQGTVKNSVQLGLLKISLTGPIKFYPKTKILAFYFIHMDMYLSGWKFYSGYISNGKKREEYFYQQSIKELELLKSAHAKYGDYVQFVTIYRDGDNIQTEALDNVKQLPWEVYGIAPGNSLWKNYQIEAFPHFVLIDATANIVASPALGPTPNGQYQTIDKTFFAIKKLVDHNNRAPKNPYDGINGGQ